MTRRVALGLGLEALGGGLGAGPLSGLVRSERSALDQTGDRKEGRSDGGGCDRTPVCRAHEMCV